MYVLSLTPTCNSKSNLILMCTHAPFKYKYWNTHAINQAGMRDGPSEILASACSLSDASGKGSPFSQSSMSSTLSLLMLSQPYPPQKKNIFTVFSSKINENVFIKKLGCCYLGT